MEIKISDVIKEKRREMGVSQEIFAEAFGVSVQAVSKWETQASLPDIMLLPRIAEYLHISMDELFFGCNCCVCAEDCNNFPDDGKLRVVQFLGSKVLTKNDYSKDVKIMLEIPQTDKIINVEIWGSADIDGDIGGSVSAGNSINCGDIGHSASAGDGINCGNIGHSASAGDSINCGNIGNDASARDNIICGNVGNDAAAGDNITCGDIHGNAEAANGSIRCHEIKGTATCGGDIIYEQG
ncbi:MAG: helix-turn-helix transcriptional regulator [Oscillospiraceae bacterium]|nr:helix-turn-helix transcriptional regulator [Oscillospiraceae bacterium]